MRIRIITDKMKEDWAKHPAKQYINTPLSSVVIEGMDPEDLEWLMGWRAKVAAFVESDEATAQAKVVEDAYAAAHREEQKLHAMCAATAAPNGHVFPSVRRQKALEAQQKAESDNAS